MAESEHHGRHRNRYAYDPARQRLRELERVIDAGAGGKPGQFLPPVARALLLIRRNRGDALRAAELLDRLQLWAQRYAKDAQNSQLREAVHQAIGHPFLDKADPLARHLGLTYGLRQQLRVRTIGACDVDKVGRAQLAKLRKRQRERARSAAKRRAAGAVPRQEFLARSLARARPWAEAGVSRATWYRRRAAMAAIGALPAETGALPAETGALPAETGALPVPDCAAETHASPHISLKAPQHTCLDGDALTRPAPARRTGNRRALPGQNEPRFLAGNGGRRSASAPHSAVASGPPADPGCSLHELSTGKPGGVVGAAQASNGVSALAGEPTPVHCDDRGRPNAASAKVGSATARRAPMRRAMVRYPA
jgi:hypothetical protein